jgi:hypothetical protein
MSMCTAHFVRHTIDVALDGQNSIVSSRDP